MITSMLWALEQPFFVRSLMIVGFLVCVFPLYGNLIVVRREANIAHSFAHMGLLGVAVALLMDRNIELMILVSVVINVVLLFLLGSDKQGQHVAHHEILAQGGLVAAILIASQMTGYRSDLSSYLFGDILLLGTHDVYLIASVSILGLLVYRGMHRRWFAISLHPSLALSKRISYRRSSLLYLIVVGLLIGSAMKIIGVLLVSAFIILPSNIGQSLSGSKQQWNRMSIIVALLASVIALMSSWYLNLPSGASIVACLLAIFGLVRVYTITKK